MQHKKHRPLILVTNDDGIDAKGFRELTGIAREFGEVAAISSQIPMSGMSHAITIKVPIRVRPVLEEEGFILYQTTGTPVDGVKLSFHTLLGRRPDLLLSGINHGSNSSASILYSGTMGAVMEGAVNHVPSIGFSLLDYRPDADFEASAGVAREVIRLVLGKGLPDGICLNVNIPSVPASEIQGIRFCKQANGYWREEFEKRTDPNGHSYYWLTGFFHNREPKGGGIGTDEWALANHYASVVPIQTDMTAHAFLEEIKEWETSGIKHGA